MEWNESIDHLRRYSNYLSPNLSLLSADTWSMFTIWLRNTMLLQLMIIMGIASVLLSPKILFLIWNAKLESTDNFILYSLVVLLFSILVIWIAGNLGHIKQDASNKPSYKQKLNRFYSANQIAILFCMIISLGVAALIWQLAEKDLSYGGSISELFFWNQTTTNNLNFIEAISYLSLIIPSYLAFFWLSKNSGRDLDIKSHLLIAIPSTIVLYFLVAAIIFKLGDWKAFTGGSVLAFTWVPPMVAGAFSLAIIVLIGIQGKDSYESIREWWGRFGAWLAIYGAAWMLIVVVTFYGPLGSEILYYDTYWKSLLLSWIGTSVTGIMAGKSATTGGLESKDNVTKSKELLAKSVPFVFMGGLVVAVALVLHILIVINTIDEPLSQNSLLGNTIYDSKQVAIPFDKTKDITIPQYLENLFVKMCLCRFDKTKDITIPQYPKHWILLEESNRKTIIIAFVGSIICMFLLSWRIDINVFSLNAFYRNRLSRCYLGATRKAKERHPHEFTGFDDDDDLEITKLTPTGPLHIFNCALNLGGSSDLSLHTRHSAIFTLSPLYCGSWYVPKKINSEPEFDNPREIGYISTEKFGGKNNQPTLGQAISVSGAAASPNMGYHTSAPVAFLMTLFDVRLGWWFPNPSLSDCKQASPKWSLNYLLYELFGIANEKSEYLAISDGGHFENLAAFELVKRKCKVIIISDGECDPKLQFEGLANLIRLCSVELGVTIDINVSDIHPKKANANITSDYFIKPNDEFDWSQKRYAIGKIFYGEDDKDYGWLIYLKASMTGNEDTAIKQYKATHPDFPHETTGDQFYAENQFESYRSLGRDIVEKLFENLRVNDDNPQINKTKSRDTYLSDLAKFLYNLL